MKTKFKGFTLIEVLLYVAMLAVFVVVISTFWQGLLDVTEKGKAMNTVNTEGQFIMTKILQRIRESNSITSPLPGNSSPTINLVYSNVNLNPTIFDLSSGNLRVSEGPSTFANLNSPDVIISDVVFSNSSGPDSLGSIRVEFEVSYKNPDGRSNLNYSQTFYGSASIR